MKTIQKKEISMTLNNVRVRHAMLLGMYGQMKNYVECLERGYLGEVNDYEKKLVDEMKDTLIKIENVCWNYFQKEGKIIND